MALKEVVRYECEHCNKDFKTPDRHVCKFDPKFKNCHSCKHCRGFKDEDREGGIDVGVGIMPTNQLYPICIKDYGDHGALDLCQMGYQLNCDAYEWCGSTWYKYVNDNYLLRQYKESD